jgi:hypothetical protein
MPGQPQASPAPSQPAREPRRDADSRSGPGEARRREVTRPLPDPVAIRLCRVPDTAPPYDDEAPGQPESGPGRADTLTAAILGALETGDRPGRVVLASAEGPRASAEGPRASAEGPRASAEGSPGGRRPPRPALQSGPTRRADASRPARAPAQAGTPAQADVPARTGTRRPGGALSQAGIARRSPEPAGWPSKFAQVLAETLAGSRPPAQLAPWTTERARSHIRKLGPLLTAGQQPQVQRVITSAPSAGVVEMSVVVGFGPRVRALAVRLEQTQARPATAGHPARQARWLCTAVEAA